MDDRKPPVLRLIDGGAEESLAAAITRAVEALDELAVRLPASDVLCDPLRALTRHLSRRLGAGRLRQSARPVP